MDTIITERSELVKYRDCLSRCHGGLRECALLFLSCFVFVRMCVCLGTRVRLAIY